MSVLCDIYGKLLPEKQRDALELYYNEDLSLAEIAEQTGISRQGVRDQIKHAEGLLEYYEKSLELHKKSVMTDIIISELDKIAQISDKAEELTVLINKLKTINE